MMDAAIAILLDKAAIVDVTIRYCSALDSKDWSLLAMCFTTDAAATYQRPDEEAPTTFVGYVSIEKRLSDSMDALLRTQHAVSNHVIDISGDEARCRCYVRAQHVRQAANGMEMFMVGGTYNDVLVRTDAGWRIRQREMTYTWCDPGWSPAGDIRSPR